MSSNRPTYIIIHCSDSLRGTAEEIDGWHRARGFARIGYHWVIRNDRPGPDGMVEQGRAEDEVGAHCVGFNSLSIGICLIGRGEYSQRQMRMLETLVRGAMLRYGIPVERVLGHNETRSGKHKGCPLMDMDAFREALRRREVP